MSTQAESRLSLKIQKALRARGWFCFKVHGGPMMPAGLPDIICCAEGLFVGLETKMPAKRSNVSVRQEYVHGLIRKADGYVKVVCTDIEAIMAVEEALATHKRPI